MMMGHTVASWLVCSSPDLRVQALTRNIVLCSVGQDTLLSQYRSLHPGV